MEGPSKPLGFRPVHWGSMSGSVYAAPWAVPVSDVLARALSLAASDTPHMWVRAVARARLGRGSGAALPADQHDLAAGPDQG
jgi:hypothetical protein